MSRTVNVSHNGKFIFSFFSRAGSELTNHLIAQELLARDYGIEARLADIGMVVL